MFVIGKYASFKRVEFSENIYLAIIRYISRINALLISLRKLYYVMHYKIASYLN